MVIMTALSVFRESYRVYRIRSTERERERASKFSRPILDDCDFHHFSFFYASEYCRE